MTSSTRLAAAFGLLAWLAAGAPAAAQDVFPSRPVTMVVPFAAGGSTDLVARLVAEKMGGGLGQQIVVENRGGAGGNTGTAAVARAEPDGYTILMGTVATHAINPTLYTQRAYDPVADFAPVSLLVRVPNVLVVNPAFPARDVKELIAKLKAEPGVHAYASAGNGSPSHLSGELLKSLAGVDIIHTPYRGAGPALVDVLAGHVPIMFDNVPPSAQHIRTGALRGLAVTTLERVPVLSDLPTVAEAGVPGFETYSWNALFAPAGTPPAAVDRLAAEARRAVTDPATRAELEKLSATVVGSGPEELAAFTSAELAKWAPIVAASGAKVD